MVSNTKRLLKDGETLPSGSGAHQNGSTLMSDPVPAVEEQELMSSSGLPGDGVRLNESTDEFGRVVTPGLAAASLNPPIIVPLKQLVRPVQDHQGSGLSATEVTDFSPVVFQGYQAPSHITSQRTPPLSTPLPTSSPAPALPGTDQGAQLAEHQRQMIANQEEQMSLMRQQMAAMAQSMGQLSHAVSIIASNSVAPSLVGGYAQSAGYAASDAVSKRSSKSQIKPAFQPVCVGSDDDGEGAPSTSPHGSGRW